MHIKGAGQRCFGGWSVRLHAGRFLQQMGDGLARHAPHLEVSIAGHSVNSSLNERQLAL